MKTYITTVILLAAFASACTVNTGTPANTAAANTNQTGNSAASPANGEKPAASPATTKKSETDASKKSSDIDTKSEEQIQFPKGETDVTLERTIAPEGNKIFLFNARKGQTLWFKITESSNQLKVDFNKNPVRLGEEVRHELNASGDWAIYVDNPTDKPLTYKLWIGIE